jgi:glycosyltransferase involved in cell wall biosynthesis
MARILYLCFANRTPTGGNKMIYRHVDLLGRLGFDAWVLHPKSDFRYHDLDFRPPVLGLEGLKLKRDDVVVIPEDAGPGMCKFARGAKKVIFNQNTYYSFRGFDSLQGPLPPYLDPEFAAALVVSEDNRRYLEYAFPGVRCDRIHLCIDRERFSFVPANQKQRKIAYMTRKNAGDVVQVLQILRSRGSLPGWQLTPIEDVNEAGVAQLLEKPALFLAFGHPEGLSLSHLEAMARGCRVIGYSGMGGREFFDQNRALEIPPGDVIAFAKAVEEEAHRFEQGCADLIAAMESAARHVQATYTAQAERDDLLRFYSDLLPGHHDIAGGE